MTAKTHPVDPELVMAYLDGELSPDEAARVVQHLDQCKECAEVAAALRSVSAQAVSWNLEPAPERITHAVFAALDSLSRSGQTGEANPESVRITPINSPAFSWKALMLSKWAWAAVGFVVVCAVGFSFQPLHKNGAMSAFQANEMEQLATRNNAIPKNLGKSASSSETYYDRKAAPGASPLQSRGVDPKSSGPMIARTASLDVSVKDFDAARLSMDRIVQAHQGYLSSLNISSERDTARSLVAKIAVPAEQCDAMLGELRALGHVTREQQGSEEISAQVTDLDARLRNARETEAQLAEILRTRTGKVGDVLEVETEIARVRGEIEVMEAEQKQLNTRVTFSSIDLNLVEEHRAQSGSAVNSAFPKIRNALVDGIQAATEGMLNLFLFLLQVGPSLLLAVLVLFFPARWAWQRFRKDAAL